MNKIKNIEQVEKILEENNVKIKDEWIFYRFWNKVDIKDNINECWNWIAGIFITGYGVFHLGYKDETKKTTVTIRSNRMTYMLTKGDIPLDTEVQHLCNNRKCCNPYHLKLGNKSENMQYMVECDRYIGSRSLTDEQVVEIHKEYNKQCKLHPEFRQWQVIDPIAKTFGIARSTVNAIINRRSYKFIKLN